MAQVSVKINGYTYMVGCEDGQESHLAAMAEQVDNRISSIKALGGQSGEARLLVLAALLMADELHDMAIDMNSLRSTRAPMVDSNMADRLNQLAARAERIAARMEHP